MATGITLNADGTITIAPATAPGTYSVTYTICQVANPGICDTATTSVVVAVALIIANDDNFTSNPINGYVGGIVGNIFVNNGNNQDSLGNALVSAATVTTSITNNGGLFGVTISPSGDFKVPAGTAAGTYFVDYNLCEKANPNNCDAARVTIVVKAPPITAIIDDYKTPINSATGGVLTNVISNDLLNGQVVIASEVTISLVNPSLNPYNFSIDSNGNINIPVGVAKGNYQIEYQICEKLNPTNCTSTFVLFKVLDPCDFDDSPSSCDVIVYNAFSPNGDGVNEFFVIEGIEKYSNNTVEIYNRWGVLVFEQKGYDNNDKSFKGFSEGRATINQPLGLPDGTYFYVIEYVKNSGIPKKLAGYLYISKDK